MATSFKLPADLKPDPAVLLARVVSIAHDLNNVLVILFSASEKLLEQLPLDHPSKKVASDVYVETRNVARLVEQISLLASK